MQPSLYDQILIENQKVSKFLCSQTIKISNIIIYLQIQYIQLITEKDMSEQDLPNNQNQYLERQPQTELPQQQSTQSLQFKKHSQTIEQKLQDSRNEIISLVNSGHSQEHQQNSQQKPEMSVNLKINDQSFGKEEQKITQIQQTKNDPYLYLKEQKYFSDSFPQQQQEQQRSKQKIQKTSQFKDNCQLSKEQLPKESVLNRIQSQTKSLKLTKEHLQLISWIKTFFKKIGMQKIAETLHSETLKHFQFDPFDSDSQKEQDQGTKANQQAFIQSEDEFLAKISEIENASEIFDLCDQLVSESQHTKNHHQVKQKQPLSKSIPNISQNNRSSNFKSLHQDSSKEIIEKIFCFYLSNYSKITLPIYQTLVYQFRNSLHSVISFDFAFNRSSIRHKSQFSEKNDVLSQTSTYLVLCDKKSNFYIADKLGNIFRKEEQSITLKQQAEKHDQVLRMEWIIQGQNFGAITAAGKFKIFSINVQNCLNTIGQCRSLKRNLKQQKNRDKRSDSSKKNQKEITTFECVFVNHLQQKNTYSPQNKAISCPSIYKIAEKQVGLIKIIHMKVVYQLLHKQDFVAGGPIIVKILEIRKTKQEDKSRQFFQSYSIYEKIIPNHQQIYYKNLLLYRYKAFIDPEKFSKDQNQSKFTNKKPKNQSPNQFILFRNQEDKPYSSFSLLQNSNKEQYQDQQLQKNVQHEAQKFMAMRAQSFNQSLKDFKFIGYSTHLGSSVKDNSESILTLIESDGATAVLFKCKSNQYINSFKIFDDIHGYNSANEGYKNCQSKHYIYVFITGFNSENGEKSPKSYPNKQITYRKLLKVNYVGVIVEQFPIFLSNPPTNPSQLKEQIDEQFLKSYLGLQSQIKQSKRPSKFAFKRVYLNPDDPQTQSKKQTQAVNTSNKVSDFVIYPNSSLAVISAKFSLVFYCMKRKTILLSVETSKTFTQLPISMIIKLDENCQQIGFIRGHFIEIIDVRKSQTIKKLLKKRKNNNNILRMRLQGLPRHYILFLRQLSQQHPQILNLGLFS